MAGGHGQVLAAPRPGGAGGPARREHRGGGQCLNIDPRLLGERFAALPRRDGFHYRGSGNRTQARRTLRWRRRARAVAVAVDRRSSWLSHRSYANAALRAMTGRCRVPAQTGEPSTPPPSGSGTDAVHPRSRPAPPRPRARPHRTVGSAGRSCWPPPFSYRPGPRTAQGLRHLERAVAASGAQPGCADTGQTWTWVTPIWTAMARPRRSPWSPAGFGEASAKQLVAFDRDGARPNRDQGRVVGTARRARRRHGRRRHGGRARYGHRWRTSSPAARMRSYWAQKQWRTYRVDRRRFHPERRAEVLRQGPPG